MAAYRTAARRFPGLHGPLLGLGLEHQRMNGGPLAERMLGAAARMCPADPAVRHELGVLSYRGGALPEAGAQLEAALALLQARTPGRLSPAMEPSLVALGHVYRKQRRYGDALAVYGQALGVAPGAAGTYAALGLTHHLAGELPAAVLNYHRALGLRPDDALTAELLGTALQEECSSFQAAVVAEMAARDGGGGGGSVHMAA